MEKQNFHIIRTVNAGVFFGKIKERKGDEATLVEVRRIWYWEGAASLSQLAVEGVSLPKACKFSVTVPEMTVLGVIELIPCSKKAIASIQGVCEWRV